jgi:hypothetical protein
VGLEQITEYVGLVNKAVTTFAIVAAGAWAYWRYVLHRENIWNLEMTVQAEHLPYTVDSALLIIKLSLKNVGKVKIMPGPSGCRVSTRKVPQGIKPGQLVTWEKSEPVIEEIDVLRHYRIGEGYPDYEIEPGCEYHEGESLVVDKGSVYLVKAEFWWKKDADSIEEYAVVEIP